MNSWKISSLLTWLAPTRKLHPHLHRRLLSSQAAPILKFSRYGSPFRMAIIGSGPAGFYTAYRVMSKLEEAIIDMYEALPVPYGLVRFGVAPDHPEVKVRSLNPQFSQSM